MEQHCRSTMPRRAAFLSNYDQECVWTKVAKADSGASNASVRIGRTGEEMFQGDLIIAVKEADSVCRFSLCALLYKLVICASTSTPWTSW